MSSNVPFRQNFWPGKWNLYGKLGVYFTPAAASVAVLPFVSTTTELQGILPQQSQQGKGESKAQQVKIRIFILLNTWHTQLHLQFSQTVRELRQISFSGTAGLPWSLCSVPCKGSQEALRHQDNKALSPSANFWFVYSQHQQHKICNVAEVEEEDP